MAGVERPQRRCGKLTGEDGGDWVAWQHRPWRHRTGPIETTVPLKRAALSSRSARGIDVPSVLRQAGLGRSEEVDRWAAGN
jgi:hypothetical protein